MFKSQVFILGAQEIMKAVAILLVCIYALSAEGAPSFSETFNATLLMQYIGGTSLSYIVRDENAGKQYWALLSEEKNIYAGQLLDYSGKQSYNIIEFGPLEGCMPLALNEPMPKFWDWLGKASDGGKAQYMDSVVEVWAGRDSDGNYREVGVDPSNPTRPVYTVLMTHQTAVQFTWLEWSTEVTNTHAFDVPLGCNSSRKYMHSALPGMITPFKLGAPKPFRPYF